MVNNFCLSSKIWNGVNMKDQEYFEYQINGLMLILLQDKDEGFISKNYVIEKLRMILSCGIGFHPSIKEKLI